MSDLIDDELWDDWPLRKPVKIDWMMVLAAVGVLGSAAAMWLAVWLQS